MKGKELVKANKTSENLTEQDIQAQVNLIQKVMSKVMQKDIHYGVIPGCGSKPALLKAGSEKLLSTFRIAIDPIVDDLSVEDEVSFRVTVRGVHAPTGNYLGAGVGLCSSNEEKYKWKEAKSMSEFESTPENRRRFKYRRNPGKADSKVMQVRSNPADVANTILKMAKKRAQIDMTLTVLAASDIFTQDIDETEVDKKQAGKPVVEQPKSKTKEAPKVDTKKLTAEVMIACARQLQFPIAKLKSMAKKCYGKTNSKELKEKEIKELIDWMKGETKK